MNTRHAAFAASSGAVRLAARPRPSWRTRSRVLRRGPTTAAAAPRRTASASCSSASSSSSSVPPGDGRDGRRLIRTPTHLVRFRRSRFAAHLTELALRGCGAAPAQDTPSAMDTALATAGAAHERRVLARLVSLAARAGAGRAADAAAAAALAAAPAYRPGSRPRPGPSPGAASGSSSFAGALAGDFPSRCVSGLLFAVPRDVSTGEARRLTTDALRAGYPVIHQPALSDGAEFLEGYADILLRNSHNPFLPPGHACPRDAYRVIEVKLASTLRPDFTLQAAAYTNFLRHISETIGLPPPGAPLLWLGAAATDPTPTDRDALDYFFQSMRSSFYDFVQDFDPDAPLPEIDAPLADLSPWMGFAKLHIEQTDSPLQVAGIRRSQVRLLGLAGIRTMQQLADAEVEHLVSSVQGIGRAPLTELKLQADLQIETRQRQRSTGDCTRGLDSDKLNLPAAPVYQFLTPSLSSPFGLHRLPPANPLDVYFDMEGFPLVPGGLEYLFGAWCAAEESGTFHTWWAHDREQEEAAFSRFVMWLWGRWHQAGSDKPAELAGVPLASDAQPTVDSGMRVYHYGHYEVTAMRRLASRTTTAEGVRAGHCLETMLDSGFFIDVYRTVKAALRIGEPSYSIKNVEHLVGVSRGRDELKDAQSSVALYYEWRRSYLEDEDCDVLSSSSATSNSSDTGDFTILHNIEAYNRQDCESLEKIVHWLRGIALDRGIDYDRWQPCLADGDRMPSETVVGPDDSSCAAARSPIARGACGSTPERKAVDSAVIQECEQTSIRVLVPTRVNSECEATGISRELLSHLLNFHIRETSPARARFGDRILRASSGDFASLYQDDQCLSKVHLISCKEPETRCEQHISSSRRSSKSTRLQAVYRFDDMEPCRLEPGASFAFVSSSAADRQKPVAGFMRVIRIDGRLLTLETGSIRTSQSGAARPPVEGSLVSSEDLVICPSTLRASLLKSVQRLSPKVCAEDSESASTESSRKYNSEPDLVSSYLRREGFASGCQTDVALSRETASDVIASMQGRALVIQGPPGTGKSTLSAELIADLVLSRGKVVAVSSNSHAAIDNLLECAVRKGVPPDNVLKIGTISSVLKELKVCRRGSLGSAKLGAVEETSGAGLHTEEYGEIVEMGGVRVGSKPRGDAAGKRKFALVGATAYALASPDVCGSFDYLFVDEAGQVPMANFMAMAPCASAAVLVGDQQQLEMPLQGKHPETVNMSCLAFFVGKDVPVVPRALGLFLETSYRMSPSLCEFISANIYNNALLSAKCTKSHAIQVDTIRASDCRDVHRRRLVNRGSGILYISREHNSEKDGSVRIRQRGAFQFPTEVQIVVDVMDELLGATFCASGDVSTLRLDDILVVAPYNAQVRALREALYPGARVGTIDKFQGQEAPVVIISTCAFPEDDLSLLQATHGDTMESEGLDNFESLQRRGTEFALRKNRLNVALSRAQCLAVIVGSADVLTKATCKSPEEAEVLSLYQKITLVGT